MKNARCFGGCRLVLRRDAGENFAFDLVGRDDVDKTQIHSTRIRLGGSRVENDGCAMIAGKAGGKHHGVPGHFQLQEKHGNFGQERARSLDVVGIDGEIRAGDDGDEVLAPGVNIDDRNAGETCGVAPEVGRLNTESPKQRKSG